MTVWVMVLMTLRLISSIVNASRIIGQM
jgi:hypothetical protein